FAALSVRDKCTVVQALIVNTKLSIIALRTMVARHENLSRRVNGKEKAAVVLRQDFVEHRCTDSCLVFVSEAHLAGLRPDVLLLDEVQQAEIFSRLQVKSNKRKSVLQTDSPRKRLRLSSTDTVNMSGSDTTFPVILTQDEKDQIVREFRASTSNTALKRYECSFCGKFELASECRLRLTTDLDISLLERAVVELRERSRQPQIQPFGSQSLVNGSYVLCHLCNSAVSKKSFHSIPLRSYAN
ncbi:hypothetical protein R3P38DRAFT_2437559, partial [Favolaschia claudopus]